MSATPDSPSMKKTPLKCNFHLTYALINILYSQADLEVLGRLADYLAENVSAMEDYLMERVNV